VSTLPAIVAYPPQQPVPVSTPSPGVVERLRLWFSQPRTALSRLPESSAAVPGGAAILGQVAGTVSLPNAASYRAYSLTPWVRAAIDIRRDQLASADWDIVTIDPDGPQNVRLRKRVRDLFDNPNAKLDSFQIFTQTLVDDLLTLDGACIEKVRYPTGQIAELWATPPDFIHVNARWDGSVETMPRYYWVPDGTVRASFRNNDFVYMMANARTITPVGVSPIYILRQVIDAELQAMEYNRRMVMGAAPNAIFNIGDEAKQEDVDKFMSKMQSEVLGKSNFAAIGGFRSPSLYRFNDSNQEMQYREWVDLLLRCIAIVYGLSPMDLGITFDVNRSSAETQSANTEDRGLRPLLALFQNYYTKEIVQDESFGGRGNNLAFRFTALNLNETQQKANINKIAMPGVGWKSINEARKMDGRDPIGDLAAGDNVFNHILIGTPKGILDLSTAKYLGEEHLAQIAAQEARVEAESAADQLEQQSDIDAARQPKPAAAGAAESRGSPAR